MPRILLPIDLSVRSDRAVRRASLLAKASGASIHLLHVVEAPLNTARVPVGGAPPPTFEELRARLSRMASAIDEFDGIQCDSRVVAGDPVEQIVLAAEEMRPALIVTAPHKPRLSDLVACSTAEALAERGRTPVLIANSLPAGGYHRVLVPTGLDEASAQIIRTIGSLPLGGPPELFTVYVRETLSTLKFNSSEDRDNYLRDELKAADSDLWNFLESSGLTEAVQRRVRLNRSTVGYEIEECASQLMCDVIAISSSQKPFLEKLVVGSVAETVVREVDADIIIFP